MIKRFVSWVRRTLRDLFPEPTWCGGCRKFSHGPCPSKECNDYHMSNHG
jgi:hypothetical protein